MHVEARNEEERVKRRTKEEATKREVVEMMEDFGEKGIRFLG